MNCISKEEYLAQAKNAMLFHFRHKDIHVTLEDISLLFQSGEENQKGEKEFCDELGSPKTFVGGLLENIPRDHFAGRLFAYIVSGLILCAITIWTMHYHSPILACIPVMIIPVFIWNLLGGSCLYEIRTEPPAHLKRYIIYYILTLPFIVMQQAVVVLLNMKSEAVLPYIHTSYYLSNILIAAAIIIMFTAIYGLYRGYCFSLGLCILSIGAVCSSLLFDYFLINWEAPIQYVCAIPYAVSFFFSILYYLYILRKKGSR